MCNLILSCSNIHICFRMSQPKYQVNVWLAAKLRLHNRCFQTIFNTNSQLNASRVITISTRPFHRDIIIFTACFGRYWHIQAKSQHGFMNLTFKWERNWNLFCYHYKTVANTQPMLSYDLYGHCFVKNWNLSNRPSRFLERRMSLF